MRDGVMRFELRHEPQLSGHAEKIKKAAHLAPAFQLKNRHLGIVFRKARNGKITNSRDDAGCG